MTDRRAVPEIDREAVPENDRRAAPENDREAVPAIDREAAPLNDRKAAPLVDRAEPLHVSSRDSNSKDDHPAESEEPPRPPSPFPWGRLVVILASAAAFLLVAGALGAYFLVQHHSRDLPDVRSLGEYTPPQVTRILARDGTLLADVFSERRTVVAEQQIPDHVKSAFLAAEDAGFFEHEGLDFLGLVRAMVVNVRAGRVKQGGSTITQQVVKNVLLDQERSYRRKVRETILAYRLERTLSKQEILGLYLNQIYLGHGRYGVQEASKHLFGKNVWDLDVAQAATLAGIVAAPERYSPYRDKAKALLRREYVLGQMLQKGFVTEQAFREANGAPLLVAPESEVESDIAPEVVSMALRHLSSTLGDAAKKGGYTVTTTIDPELQVKARQAVRSGLDDYLKRQKLAPPFTLSSRKLWGKAFTGKPRRHGIYVGSVLALDDASGTVTVKVGDATGVVDLRREERFNPQHLEPSKFVGIGAALRVRVEDEPSEVGGDEKVRLSLELGPQAALIALSPRTREVLAAVGSYEATSGALDRSVQSKRQPGSTFKPIVYSYALNTHQVTAATQFEFTEPAEAGEPPAPVRLSLRQGIATSDNRVAESVFRTVGAEQAVGWAETLGFRSHLGADESLMLGSYEVTVLEMANAFSVFASGGTAQEPTFFQRVDGPSDLPLLPERGPERRVMDPAVAYLTTDLLRSVIREGTGKRAASLGRPLAGKTGTTNRSKDAWFVGYSADLVVAVWVGFDDALPLGWGESGATSALPIWIDFMKAAHEKKRAVEFPRPAGIRALEIDPHTGLLPRFGQEDTQKELFLIGTEPEEVAPEPSSPEEFPEESPEGPPDAPSPDQEGTEAVVDAPPPPPPPPPPPLAPPEDVPPF